MSARASFVVGLARALRVEAEVADSLRDRVLETTPEAVLRAAMADFEASLYAPDRFAAVVEKQAPADLRFRAADARTILDARDHFPAGSDAWWQNQEAAYRGLLAAVAELRAWLSGGR